MDAVVRCVAVYRSITGSLSSGSVEIEGFADSLKQLIVHRCGIIKCNH